MLAAVISGNRLDLEWWPLTKLVHFPVYWTIIALLLAILFVMGRRWKLAALSGVLAVGYCVQVAALWAAPAAPGVTAGSEHVRLMTFNVYRDNKRPLDVLRALQQTRPEVLYLTEMSPDWHAQLKPVIDAYPHRLGKHSNLLLSLHPLEDARAVPVTFDNAQFANKTAGGLQQFSESLRAQWRNTEVLVATVRVGGRRLRVAGIHPPTPGSNLSAAIQRAVALVCGLELQKDRPDACVMMGDFNTTAFSPTFRFILSHTGLCDTARGKGYAPTWGPRVPDEPWLPWLGIPIDHVLVSDNVRVLAREVGPPLGSDHRWILAHLAF